MVRFGSGRGLKITLEDARDMMLRDENSKLRVIAIANMQYKVDRTSYLLFGDFYLSFFLGGKGKWVLEEVDQGVALKFVVSAGVAEDKWQTWSIPLIRAKKIWYKVYSWVGDFDGEKDTKWVHPANILGRGGWQVKVYGMIINIRRFLQVRP